MRHNSFFVIPHHRDQFPCDLGSFDATESDAKIPGQLAKIPQQVCQTDPLLFGLVAVPVHSVMSEVNSGQYDFTVSSIGQAPHFIDNMLMGSACQLRADMGNDAVAATKQAAILDFDVRAVSTGKTIKTCGYINHSKA